MFLHTNTPGCLSRKEAGGVGEGEAESEGPEFLLFLPYHHPPNFSPSEVGQGGDPQGIEKDARVGKGLGLKKE